MSPFTRTFHAALARARDRLAYARRERDRFLDRADLLDERQARTARKLDQDVEKAERDVAWAQHRLADAESADEASSAFKRPATAEE